MAEALALAFRFARISIALLIRLSSNTTASASMLLRPVERSGARHSQLTDLTIYLGIVLLHCVATITVTTTLMNVVVSCILLIMKRQLLSRYGCGRENLVAFFNTSFL